MSAEEIKLLRFAIDCDAKEYRSLRRNLSEAVRALQIIRDLDAPTKLSNDLGVNEYELQVKSIKLIARAALKEIE